MKKKTIKPKKTIWLKYGDKWVTIGELEKRLDNFFELLKKHENLFMDYSEKYSQLKYRIEQLEFHEKNAIRVLEGIGDRLNKLEISQPKYKVGDYVEYYICGGENFKGHITWYKGGYYGIDSYYGYMKEDNIIGYAKPDLLTPEEKEYLSVVIKPFRNEVDYIVKECDGSINFGNYESGSYIGCCLVYCYHFRNLKEIKRYKLKELGL